MAIYLVRVCRSGDAADGSLRGAINNITDGVLTEFAGPDALLAALAETSDDSVREQDALLAGPDGSDGRELS
jgi:hypothetical protein